MYNFLLAETVFEEKNMQKNRNKLWWVDWERVDKFLAAEMQLLQKKQNHFLKFHRDYRGALVRERYPSRILITFTRTKGGAILSSLEEKALTDAMGTLIDGRNLRARLEYKEPKGRALDVVYEIRVRDYSPFDSGILDKPKRTAKIIDFRRA